MEGSSLPHHKRPPEKLHCTRDRKNRYGFQASHSISEDMQDGGLDPRVKKGGPGVPAVRREEHMLYFQAKRAIKEPRIRRVFPGFHAKSQDLENHVRFRTYS